MKIIGPAALALLLCWPAVAAAEGELCLRLVWAESQALLAPLTPARLAGRSFAKAAAQAVEQNGGRMRLTVSCLERAKIDPAVLRAARGLGPGQVSAPFDLAQGRALVQPTTLAFRLEGKALFDQGQYAQAERLLLKDLDLNPDSALCLHLLGLCRVWAGDHLAAVAYFDQALEVSPRNPAIIGDKASSLLAMGRLAQAAELYDQALALGGDNPILLNNLAWVLANQRKDLARAERMAKRAVELAPDQAALWVTLGEVQAARGRHASAVSSLRRALELNPDERGGAENLAKSLAKLDAAQRRRLAAAEPTPEPTPARQAPAPTPTSAARPPAGRAEAAQTPAGYYLQAGSHPDEAQAQAQLAQWRALGQACLLEQWRGGAGLGPWWRVLLGPLASREAALARAEELRRQGALERWVLLWRP